MIVTAIDIGNTRTHIAMIDNNSCKCLARLDIQSKNINRDLLESIHNLYKKNNRIICSGIIISSVIKSLVDETISLLQSEKIPVEVFRYSEKLPLKINYLNPYQLGTDRIANALYGYKTFPDDNLVIISSGTALVIDLVKGGQFMGGAILPGLNMQSAVLHTSTNALPEINLNDNSQLPGQSTEECLRAGILYGTAGALNYIISHYRKKLNDNLKILTTGGAWPLLERYVDFEFLFIPDMTLIGISLFTDTLY